MTQRVLIIGAGAIARHHAAAAATVEGLEVLAADPADAARESFAAEHPTAQLFADVDAMLGAAGAGGQDVAIVAVPPWLHAPMAVRAFEAGYHVLCEKPVGRTLSEVEIILEAAARVGRLLGDCAIRFNNQPAAARVREMLGRQALGALGLARMIHRIQRVRPGLEYQLRSRWFLSRERAGGGLAMDWSVYDLAMLFDVLAPVAVTVDRSVTRRVAGRDDPPDVPVEVESHVVAMMTLDLGEGTLLPLLYERGNGVNGPALSELSIEGTQGGVSWRGLPPYEDDRTEVTRYVDTGGAVAAEVERIPMGGSSAFPSPAAAGVSGPDRRAAVRRAR
ncbi:Gfo/Idh/MocA family protein [Roseisalinus antarcticus]|uniref:1,5-anhydro-D-fructose reductase n=1 Tax=Roseisalinus antarcticus TaxID=254357 RepID=A0A1Y5TDG1_9RHOB|nr:Gfo/Idh/MocA family oxidoreductase [Roseisalinus antarcticus]SLN61485.1 1,5-anhydro-D-fructose reductase [Roseisalinus antarcticus]